MNICKDVVRVSDVELPAGSRIKMIRNGFWMKFEVCDTFTDVIVPSVPESDFGMCLSNDCLILIVD